MKNLYTVSAYDFKTDTITENLFFTNKAIAKKSFDSLKAHMIKKLNLVNPDVETWTFNTGGTNRTDCVANQFNVTIVNQPINTTIATYND